VGSDLLPSRENPLSKGLGRPVSRILLYPAIHLRGRDAACCVPTPGSLWEPRLPARLPFRVPGQFGLLAPVVYLAGPSRDTAGGLLPHPFTHHLCRMGSPLSGHRLVYSLLHLTWRRACAAPPLGFLARAAFPGAKVAPSRVRTLLCEPTLRGRITATGRTAQTYLDIIPQVLGAGPQAPGPEARAPAADKHDLGRGQAKLDPLRAAPALLPARVVAN
jgi:hypothetical protein